MVALQCGTGFQPVSCFLDRLEACPTPGSTNARVASASNSSEPLPTMMFSGLHRCSFASFSRSPCAVGLGYNRNRPSTAILTAASTFGDGGYGFSFVLSLINPLIFGCSPRPLLGRGHI